MLLSWVLQLRYPIPPPLQPHTQQSVSPSLRQLLERLCWVWWGCFSLLTKAIVSVWVISRKWCLRVVLIPYVYMYSFLSCFQRLDSRVSCRKPCIWENWVLYFCFSKAVPLLCSLSWVISQMNLLIITDRHRHMCLSVDNSGNDRSISSVNKGFTLRS